MELARTRGAVNLRVIGPVPKGTEADASDLDLLVDLEPERNVFDLEGLPEALADPYRLACQIMTLGTWDDVLLARAELTDDLFKAALRQAPPGVMDARSWNYWHLVLESFPFRPCR